MWTSFVLVLLICACRCNADTAVTADKTEVAPPGSLKQAIDTDKLLLMNGAPGNAYPRVIDALNLPSMPMFYNKMLKIMNEVKEGLRYAFQTKNPWTWPITGTGHFGAQAVLENLVEPGDTVLFFSSGLWGERISKMAERIGANVKVIYKPIGSAFYKTDVEEAINAHKPDVVYLIHGESSTGVINQVSEIGDICRRDGCLVILDCVTTLGIVPVFVDKWKIDAAYANAHKGLGCIPGYAPVTLGPRAVEKMKRRMTLNPSFVLDAQNLTKAWILDPDEQDQPSQYIHTIPKETLYALREALAIMAEETLEKIWERHSAATQRFYDGIEETDLQYFVTKVKSRCTGTITITKPDYVKDLGALMKFMNERHQVDLGPGLGPTVGKVIRVGIFGPNANSDEVDLALKALKEGLEFMKTGNLPVSTFPQNFKIPEIPDFFKIATR